LSQYSQSFVCHILLGKLFHDRGNKQNRERLVAFTLVHACRGVHRSRTGPDRPGLKTKFGVGLTGPGPDQIDLGLAFS